MTGTTVNREGTERVVATADNVDGVLSVLGGAAVHLVAL